MKKKILLIIVMLQATMLAIAQTAYGPYLQSPTPNSIWVSWITTSNTETTLTWGTSPSSLTNSATGEGIQLASDHIVHHAQITGLQPNTPYFYQVKTGSYTSPVSRFVSAPAVGTSTGKIHYLVFGDTQSETAVGRVAPRIKTKLIERFGNNWEDSCRFMIKLGDNVDNGGTLSQYKSLFVGSIQYVSNRIPMMTVPGNHEYYGNADLSNFFTHVKYESLRYNDIPGKNGEHFYAFPYANMLFTMFNSNENWKTQTDFITKVVNTANDDNRIKWIFSGCHHPVQVEECTPDGSPYVANTITPILRNSTKGVTMYSGHSHLYQRGATREGSLYQIINGGASWIQRWNQSDQKDFVDVQKTIDHYLFQIVSMDLTNNEMTVQTYSNGTDTYDLVNKVIDTYSKKLGVPAPAKPSVVPAPASLNLPYTFQGSTYNETIAYNSTQFQIVETTGRFSSPRIDEKRDFEDIYLASDVNKYSPIDQNAGIDIFKYTAALNSLQSGLNKIRVRYRDKNLNWSAWSDSIVFKVNNGTSPLQQNPIAWYQFSNNTNDNSGFNRNATNSGITFTQDALVKSSVGVFNNAAYADIATTPNGLPVKNITVSAWVNIKSDDEWGGFIGYLQDNGSTENGWVLGTHTGHLSFAIRGINTSTLTYLDDQDIINYNQWYHVVGSYDGYTQKLYVNGVLKATSTAQSGKISYHSSGSFTLGRYKDDDENYPHDGFLDDVKMWERTLSDAEVTAEYKNTNQIALPIAEFNTSNTSISAGGTVTFNNNSHNSIQYKWSFPGAIPNVSTVANPTVTYPTAGKYDVILNAFGPGGKHTETKIGYITVTGLGPNLPSGTVVYYNFVDNTNDVSGNNYHAIPTTVSYNNRNGDLAGNFDGINAFADIKIGTGASSILPTAAITVMGWVRVDAFDEWGGFVSCVQDNGSTENGWVLGTKNNKFSFGLRSSGASINYLTSSETATPGVWYHVAGTYDGTTHKLYVDGKLKATSTLQNGAIKYATNHWFTMGRYKDEDEDWKHQGGLDEVYVVNRALPETEIAKYASSFNLPSVTVAYYNFEYNTKDASVNKYDATPTSITYSIGAGSAAANFDGTNSFADIKTGADPSKILPTAAITVMGWVKVNNFDEWGGFVSCVQDNGSTENGWVLGSRNNQFSFALRSSGAGLNYLTSPETATTGVWYHVAGTYDGTTHNLYVNGVLKASSTSQTGAIKYATNHWFTMGRYKDDNEDWRHDGSLDQVFVLNRALSAFEITTMSNFTARRDLSEQTETQSEVLTVNVYPVPTSDIITVDLKGNTDVVTYELANNLGLIQFAGQLQTGETSINISSLPSGTYILRFHDAKGVVWKKIVKE